MKLQNNKPTREEFTHAFMNAFRFTNSGKPFIKKAYNKPFTVIETRANYKVTVGGVTKRFSNLCQAGEFIFDKTFDRKYVYRSPLVESKALKLQKMQETLNEGETWTNLTLTRLPTSNARQLKKFIKPRASFTIGLTN